MVEQRIAGPVVVFLLVQFLADVFVALLVAMFGIHGPETWLRILISAILLSIPFSQVSLLSLWSALGPGRAIWRLAASLTAGVVIWLLDFGLAFLAESGAPTRVAPAVAMFLQWIVIQIPLWGVRIFAGWQIDREGRWDGARAALGVQFGIKHLLGWMTFVAATLAIGRIIVANQALREQDMVGFGIFLAFNSLFAWPTLLFGLAQRRTVAGGLAALGFMVVVTIAQPMVFRAFHAGGHQAVFFWALNGIQFAWMTGCVWYFRRLGFRLVRPEVATAPSGRAAAAADG